VLQISNNYAFSITGTIAKSLAFAVAIISLNARGSACKSPQGWAGQEIRDYGLCAIIRREQTSLSASGLLDRLAVEDNVARADALARFARRTPTVGTDKAANVTLAFR
jgi:hypothetical protein